MIIPFNNLGTCLYTHSGLNSLDKNEDVLNECYLHFWTAKSIIFKISF